MNQSVATTTILGACCARDKLLCPLDANRAVSADNACL